MPRDRIAVSAFGLAIHLPLFLGQPILAEARQFLETRGGAIALDPVSIARGVLEPTGYNSRFVSMAAFRVMFDLFGYRAEWINLVQILLVVASAVLILEYVATVAGSRGTGRLVAVLWLLSAGTANALSWQATNHEKLALLFSLAAVLALARARSTWGANVAVAAFVALALNSKEIAFFLLAVLPVQALLTSGTSALKRVALPCAFAATFIAIYLLRLTPAWGRYAFAESPWGWIVPYAAALVNIVQDDFRPVAISAGGLRAIAAGAAVSVVALGVAVFVVAWARGRSCRARGAAIAATWFLASFVIVLNQGASLYCLLVPSVGFLALVAIVAEDLLGARGARTALVAWLACSFAFLALPGHALGQHVAACRRVAAAHEVMRAQVPETAVGPFLFVQDGGNARLRWLFFDSSERCVMNFALRRTGELPHSIADREPVPPQPYTYAFEFDSTFTLRRILRGDRELYR